MLRSISVARWAVLVTIAALAGCSSSDSNDDDDAMLGSGLNSSTGIFKGLGGKCLDGTGTTNGSKVVLWTCDGTPAQNWTVSGREIRGPGGKCLDVQGNKSTNGTPVILWDCNGGANQKWTVDDKRNRIVGLGGKCLDVSAWNTADGAKIAIWDCRGKANQQWVFQPSTAAPAATTAPSPTPAPTPAPSPTPAPTTPAPTTSGGLTIDQVISDMSSPSEALPINPVFEWQSNPAIIMYAPRGDAIPSWWTGNRPQWCYSETSWFVAQEAQGNKATNTRVQVKNLRIYIQSQATRTWSIIDSSASPLTELWKYPFDYVGPNAGVRTESSGGISIKPAYPQFHHGYGHSTGITPADVRAVFVAMDFRLTVDDPNKPDDRASAKYVVDAGADYYPGNGQDWSLGYAPGMGDGRMLLATNNWRTATLLVPNKNYGSTFDDIRSNPPPLN